MLRNPRFLTRSGRTSQELTAPLSENKFKYKQMVLFPMIKNIVFDWSGTISDDFETVYHTIRAMFHDVDVAPISFARFQEVVDIPYYAYLKKLYGNEPETLAKFSDKKRNHELFNKNFRNHGLPPLLPGVEPALKQLQSKGFNMVVFSSHHQNFLEEENKAFFNGRNYFSHIFGSAGNKMNSVSKLLEETKFNPDQTLFVGDTTHDILAGKKAGMKTAVVLTGYHVKEQLSPLKPDFILNSVSELPGIL